MKAKIPLHYQKKQKYINISNKKMTQRKVYVILDYNY